MYKSVFSEKKEAKSAHFGSHFYARNCVRIGRMEACVHEFIVGFGVSTSVPVLVKPDNAAKKIPCDYQKLQVNIKTRVECFSLHRKFRSLHSFMSSECARQQIGSKNLRNVLKGS